MSHDLIGCDLRLQPPNLQNRCRQEPVPLVYCTLVLDKAGADTGTVCSLLGSISAAVDRFTSAVVAAVAIQPPS